MSEPAYLTAFFAAVYPNMTELAVTMAHTEKQLLTDATSAILDARKEIKNLGAMVDRTSDKWNAECAAREKAERDLALMRPVVEAAVAMVKHLDDMRFTVPSTSWPSDKALWLEFASLVRAYAAKEQP